MSDIRNKVEAGGIVPPAPAVSMETAGDVRVWDPLVRLFHWLLVAAFITAWITGDELKSVHIYAGYTIIGLLAVRVLWGLFGSTHARFSDFVYHPATTLGYLADMVRLRARRYLGHNPAGGMMVLALIGMLSAITATGYMMTTDAYWGVQWVEEAHETLVNITLVLIGLHLAGVAFASFEHRENLVKAMITGRKRAG